MPCPFLFSMMCFVYRQEHNRLPSQVLVVSLVTLKAGFDLNSPANLDFFCNFLIVAPRYHSLIWPPGFKTLFPTLVFPVRHADCQFFIVGTALALYGYFSRGPPGVIFSVQVASVVTFLSLV